jgi:hypothetical protein
LANSIYYKNDPETVGMSNGLTSVFINVLGLSGSRLAVKDYEKNLIIFLLEKDQAIVGIGTVGFDICEMPWNEDVFKEQKQFLFHVIDDVLEKNGWNELSYTPRYDMVADRMEAFRKLLQKMKVEDIDKEAIQEWMEVSKEERKGKDKYPVCEIHNVLLTCFGCQVCHD